MVTAMLAEWRALLALKENQYDETQSSDDADRMDRRAARDVGRRAVSSGHGSVEQHQEVRVRTAQERQGMEEAQAVPACPKPHSGARGARARRLDLLGK